MTDNESMVREWYGKHRSHLPPDRHDLLRNPEVLFQHFAIQRAIIEALRDTHLMPATARVLDVGCGDGSSLVNLLPLRFSASNLHGVDVLRERIEAAKMRLNGFAFEQADATALRFADQSFDLVMAHSLFSLLDPETSEKIAVEMARVTARGGYILDFDWRYARPGSGFRPIRAKELAAMFPRTTLVSRRRGAIVPPIGRPLSRFAPWAYFAAGGLMPFLRGGEVTVLRKA
jgi:ubiquinone/menaquinone biosynthesis C-methylase UbiE